ncbi:MAG: MATE family efflux transporter [Lachnospira sp.]
MKQNRWFVQKLFMKFFVPALLSSLGLAIGAVADCLYIGKMLNEDGLYIIGVASPIYMIFTTWSVALAVGGSIHFSKILGEGDVNQGRKIFSNTILGDFIGICILSAIGLICIEPLINLLGVSSESLYFAETKHYVKCMLICCPILFMQAPLQYFVHADDNPKLASWALVMGCICDCAAGYVFIVLMNAGVAGSVWSTLAGAIVMEGICFCHFIFKKGSLRIKPENKFSIGIVLNSFKTGFATATQYLYRFVILLVFNRILFRISGESGVAIYDISENAVSLVIAVIDAVVLAMIPMVSTFYGERNRNDVSNCLWIALRTGLITTGIAAAILIVLAPDFCRFLGVSAELVADGAFAIRIVVLSSIVACVNNVLATFFQNIGLEKASYPIILAREFVVLLACGLICSSGGFALFWYAYIITELLVMVGTVCVIVIRKMICKKQIIQFDEGVVFAETFVGSCEKISDTCERLQRFLENSGASVKQAYFVTLTVDEICRLIAENTGNLMLQLTLVDASGEYILHIRDNAGKFNPFEVNDDDEHGLGLKVVKKQAKEYYYRQFVGFNTLTVSFAKEG